MEIKSYIESAPKGYAPHIVCEYDRAKSFIDKHSKRVIMTGPDGSELHRALQLRKDGYALIMLSKAVLKSWKKEVGDLVTVSIRPDDTEFGMPMPEEFKVTLEMDPEASAAFDALQPGRKRGLLHYAGSPKSEASRIKRALELAEKLRTGTLHGGA